MTKVLAQKPCCARADASLKLSYGAEDFLDDFHNPRPDRRLSAAPLVGPGVDHPHPLHLMVDRLPQRLVLSLGSSRTGSTRRAQRHCETSFARRLGAGGATTKRPRTGDRSCRERTCVRRPDLRTGLRSSQCSG